MSTTANKALQKDSLILITGGTGWLGSHIVEKAIQHGLRVRMAIRDEQKANRLMNGLRQKYGQSIHLETVKVKDFTENGAYDEAVKGVEGIIHSAATVNFEGTWQTVVVPCVRSYELLLKAANSPDSIVKRVVFTSSSTVVGFPNLIPGTPIQRWTNKTWNDNLLKEEDKDKEDERHAIFYATAKMLSEKYAWNFLETKKPIFNVNVIVPNVCMGKKAVGSDYFNTGAYVKKICMEQDDHVSKTIKPQYFINVEDAAMLHVLALTHEDIVNERIIAFNELFNWDQVIDLGKMMIPPEKFNPTIKTQLTGSVNYTIVERQRVKDLLKPFGGMKDLEQTVRENLQD